MLLLVRLEGIALDGAIGLGHERFAKPTLARALYRVGREDDAILCALHAPVEALRHREGDDTVADTFDLDLDWIWLFALGFLRLLDLFHLLGQLVFGRLGDRRKRRAQITAQREQIGPLPLGEAELEGEVILHRIEVTRADEV